jgi:hypothetical protein
MAQFPLIFLSDGLPYHSNLIWIIYQSPQLLQNDLLLPN